jgi:hypothetical protein
LIDEIREHSPKPPVIIFMGDHGFREFTLSNASYLKYHYMNLNAVYLPTNDYRIFHDSLPMVNHFRALLNTSFGQKLPMLKDSTILIRE